MSDSDSILTKSRIFGWVEGVVCIIIISGFGVAYAQNATNAEIRTKMVGMEDGAKEQRQRLDKMDGKIDAMAASVGSQMNSLQQQQIQINTKMDMLLEQKRGK